MFSLNTNQINSVFKSLKNSVILQSIEMIVQMTKEVKNIVKSHQNYRKESHHLFVNLQILMKIMELMLILAIQEI